MADKKQEDFNTQMEEENLKAAETADTQAAAAAEAGAEANAEQAAEDTEKADGQAQEESQPDPLEQAQQQLEMLKDQYLRSVAEFENFKKRTIKEKAELIQNGGAKTVVAILPILDDFERALADQSEDPKAIREGMQVIFNKFIQSLEGLGVKKIDALEKDFDTDYHEAVAMVPGMGDEKKGKVIDCLQTGYTMNDKVIRHAKVAVGQ
ncbi:MAG: nucleotide exchange factor GrpE [Prevotella sp.]|nr:nucleotide exchange factor GrpE [Prevotella sp.]